MGYFQGDPKMYGFKEKVVEKRHKNMPLNNRLGRLYHTVHTISPAIFRKRRAPPSDPTAFPFLRLPRELREMVYDYFRQPESHSMELITAQVGPWPWNTFDLPRETGPDDPTAHQPPGSSGILSYYGTVPPLDLRLTCKQVHHELWSNFLSTMCRVGPLTPHSDEWRFDPTYQKLNTSTLLPTIRHILVRVELVNLKMTKHYGSIRYQDIGLEECALKLQALAEMLVRVLRKRASSLRTLTIEWQDDFPSDGNWQLKASALLPFGTLEGVHMQLGKLIVAEEGRTSIRNMLNETLDGLSAME
jgi:hypothetical protein